MMETITLIIAIVALAMHAIAPMTKNTVDDKIAAALDEMKEKLSK